DQIQHIFKEFHRIRRSNMDNKGLGLGLAIARRLGTLLQHDIHVHSTVDRGTVFTVSVPVVAMPQQPAIASRSQAAPTDLALPSLTVFCVDNEPIILHSIESLLQQWHCHSITASSLDSA